MATKYELNQGDTSNDFIVRLKDHRGYIDLTGAVVTLTINPYHDIEHPVIVDAVCIPFPDQTNATKQGDRGKVRHVWQPGEVTIDKLNRDQRIYEARFHVTKNAQTETFPKNKQYPFVEFTVV